jgi:hypothetical protein
MEELIPITLFLCIAAVAILRPVSTRLGGLLEAMTRERHATAGEDTEVARLRVQLDHIGKRIDLMEERLDFTERLLSTTQPGRSSVVRAEPLRERESSFGR